MRVFAPVALLSTAMTAGGRLEPSRPPQITDGSSQERIYYIAADEVMWDYAPRGRRLTGSPSMENEAVEGSVLKPYRKAVYREYTDATFETLKPRPPEWEHLGILGPVIRGEVGDTLRVVFRNATGVFYSMHPHGVAYDKASEGALYNDGTSGADKADDLVPPGRLHTYTWTVPPRAGPGPGDPSSIVWMYHSHFVEPKDMNTGLIGPIIISADGVSGPDGRPRDVDREFVADFAIFDETASAYVDANIVVGSRLANLRVTDPAFRSQYLFYTINGFVEGNLPALAMRRGERVRWYLMANSNEEDVHGAHWHGQTAVVSHMRSDTVPLMPMGMAVADMVPDRAGTWLFHCHTNEHFDRGMQALFTVAP